MRDIHGSHCIATTASKQKGLIRSEQLYACGKSRSAVARLVAGGWLHPQYESVYAVGHTALDDQARYLAATYALWPLGTLAHRSAGALRRIAPAGGPIHVTVPTANGHPHRGDIRVHRQALRPDEVEAWHGIRCTTVCRTVLDLAASAPRLLADAFEEAQVRYRLSPEQLAEELVLRRGHRGTARIRALLAGAVDPAAVQSRLELRFLKLCHEHGLPRPLTQSWLGRWPVDFLFVEERVVIETDGGRYHASAAKRRRDARKDEELTAMGFLVVRLRWSDVVDAPAATANALRATLTTHRVS